MASVPLAQLTQCLTPNFSAKAFSKPSTYLPPTKAVSLMTDWMAGSISDLMDWYWALRSTNGTFMMNNDSLC